jgi:hypothetical protein
MLVVAGAILGCAPEPPPLADVAQELRPMPVDTAPKAAVAVVVPLTKDSIWSPDRTMVAWFKHWPSADSTEIWLGYRDGRAPVRLTGKRYVGDQIDEDKTLPVYRSLQFTHDGTQLVALTPRNWTVSDRVVLIDLSTRQEVPIEVGALQVVPLNGGVYAGMYILYQGRLGEEDGRRFGYWLYTKDFVQVRQVADDDGVELARWLIRNKALVDP